MSDRLCPRCGERLREDVALPDLCSACLLDLSLPRDAGAASAGSLLPQLTVLNVIGEGPRAHAYLARFAPPDGGLAAVKRMKPGQQRIAWDSASVQRVLQLDHPHVASVFDVGLDPEGRAYSVSDYAPGLPITHFCRRHSLLEADRAELLLQAADALQYAHAIGLLHLNLKPSNIVVVQGTASIRLLDFEATLPCNMPAIPYRAPEQVSGTPPTARSDVYSLGMMLLELLEDVPDATSALRDVAEQATEHEPDARFADVEAVAQAVRTALGAGR